MPLDFPSSPAINDTWTGANGVTYTWNGTMWTVSGSGSGTAYLPLSGGTMTGGDITLFRDPTQPLHASPRRYVDNAINLAGNYLGTWSVAANSPNISAGGSISNANYVATTVNPANPEVAPVGIPGIAGMTIANGDRIIWAAGPNVWQILRNAGLTLAAADARYVDVTGDTMSGALTLPGNAGSALQAVPLQQVPVASSTVPVMDGTAAVGAGTTWAKADHIHPTDTSRASTAAVTAAAAAAANNVGRNLIHNPLFNVAQRGVGPFTVGGMSLDRWMYGYGAGESHAVSQAALSDANRASIGDEAAVFGMGSAFGGTANAGSYIYTFHRIENVLRLAGKTVTVSFYANASFANAKIGVSIDQNFGWGGSSSPYASGTGQPVTLSSTAGAFSRYSVTLAIPSAAGKTLGTNSDHYTEVNFWYSSGSTNASRAGNIGVQSGNINLWGVQLEIGTQATPLDYGGTPQQQLAECQRFYQVGRLQYSGYGAAGAGIVISNLLPVPMRALPTVVPTISGPVNVTSPNMGALNAAAVNLSGTATATGAFALLGDFTASADL